MKNISNYLELYNEVKSLGAKDMESCMQCGTCSASCPLSQGSNPFPRKIYRFIQMGLKERLRASPEPWLCYYCGECNKECPRGAEPAETMMAVRRWLTMQYDWTGLARKFYLSAKWEFGALAIVSLFVVMLFTFFHGPIITDRVAVNTFAPVAWVELADLLMAAILAALLFSNGWRMQRFIMDGTKAPVSIYLSEAREFFTHFLTQKKWRQCGENRSRWLKHFLLVSGYLTMLTLIIVFLRWFQVDDSSWHFTSLFGYYATGVLLYITAEMLFSRLKKQETMHRYSHISDYLFLVLLFATTLTGIIMHIVRLAGWPMGTYVMYVIHLAIAVPMLVIEVPFGKWAHLFYRPFAVFLAKVKEKADNPSVVDLRAIRSEVGDNFSACMHCGTCSTVCPSGTVANYSPRLVLRHIALDRATSVTVDEASWLCSTCNSCTEHCPRGVGFLDILRYIRKRVVEANLLPKVFESPVANLRKEGIPWRGKKENRLEWAGDIKVPVYDENKEYCLFNCCTIAYDPGLEKRSQKGGLALLKLLDYAKVSFGTLGTKENCCGDMVDKIGVADVAEDLQQKNTDMFLDAEVAKILTVSPHCLNTFSKDYSSLKNIEKLHYVELLDELISSGVISPQYSLDLKVTYHDPCYLGRHNGIYNQPRRILESIPGLELVEMESNREHSFCCGGGGGGLCKNDSISHGLGENRIREALQSGATILATACPYCIHMLSAAVNDLGVIDKIKIRDISELLLASLDRAEHASILATSYSQSFKRSS